jgi:hypothetical protein
LFEWEKNWTERREKERKKERKKEKENPDLLKVSIVRAWGAAMLRPYIRSARRAVSTD